MLRALPKKNYTLFNQNSRKTKKNKDFNSIFKPIAEVIKAEGMDIDQDFGIATTLTALKVVCYKEVIGHICDSGLVVF